MQLVYKIQKAVPITTMLHMLVVLRSPEEHQGHGTNLLPPVEPNKVLEEITKYKLVQEVPTQAPTSRSSTRSTPANALQMATA